MNSGAKSGTHSLELWGSFKGGEEVGGRARTSLTGNTIWTIHGGEITKLF